jgi:hypothetical protein
MRSGGALQPARGAVRGGPRRLLPRSNHCGARQRFGDIGCVRGPAPRERCAAEVIVDRPAWRKSPDRGSALCAETVD